MLFVLLNLWINTMVACVIEELYFVRKVNVVSASDVALKPLMDRLKEVFHLRKLYLLLWFYLKLCYRY